MEGAKPQLHNSDMESIGMCGIKWQRTRGYLFGCWHERVMAPPSTQLAIGSSVHKSVEVNLYNKIETEQLIEREQASQSARDEFQVIWEGGMMLSNDEAVNVKKTHGDSADLAVQLSLLHYDELAPWFRPVAVEKKFVIAMPDHSVDLAGKIDLIEAIPTEETPKEGIRDVKTKASSPPKDTAEKSIQLGMYALARKVETGKLPARMSLDYLVKTKTPKKLTLSVVPDNSWLDPVKARIAQTIRVIEAVKAGQQIFQYADPTHWICSERYCILHKMGKCEFVRPR